MPKGVNVGGMVGHCALRHYVMGERGLDDIARDRGRHRRDDRSRRRGDGGRRARLLDLAHAAAPRPRRPVRCPGTWARRATSSSRSPRCSAGTGKGVYEVAPRFERPGDDVRRHRAEIALDGRGQPAHRPAGDVRARAEQRRTRAVQGHPRPRRRGSRERRRAPTADDGARHRPPLRPAAPHVLRPDPVVGGAASARPRRSAWPCSTTTRAGPS